MLFQQKGGEYIKSFPNFIVLYTCICKPFRVNYFSLTVIIYGSGAKRIRQQNLNEHKLINTSVLFVIKSFIVNFYYKNYLERPLFSYHFYERFDSGTNVL